MDSISKIFKRIHPQLKKYNVDHILEVLEEILNDEGDLSDEMIIELVADILENDPLIS